MFLLNLISVVQEARIIKYLSYTFLFRFMYILFKYNFNNRYKYNAK